MDENVLHKAATTGDELSMKLFLSQKQAKHIINRKNVLGSSPLHNAAHNGHLNCVHLLLACGADPEAVDNFGYKPLDVALSRKHIQCAELLFQFMQTKQQNQRTDANIVDIS